MRMGEILGHSCRDLLAEAGIPLDEVAADALNLYLDLVREWNDSASLVSRGDLEHLVDKHVVDSLSLAPVILEVSGKSGQLLDIGSGGGFPAIPLKIALPNLGLTLVERSRRRGGFLMKVVGKLGLSGVEVVLGEFPGCVQGPSVDVITARAVEKPQRVLRAIARSLRPGAVFLCQSGDPSGLLGPEFHVEHVKDTWHDQGLRRGELYLVRRLPDQA